MQSSRFIFAVIIVFFSIGLLPGAAHGVAYSASADGVYVAAQVDAPKHAGIWLYQVSSNTWTRLANRPGAVQWLPGHRQLVVGRATAGTVAFSYLTVDGKEEPLRSPGTCCYDWKVLPDGSGIVATCDRPKKKTGIAICLYRFVDGTWRSIATYPHVDHDKGTGDHIALRKLNGVWILSCHERGPSDSRSLWVNLATGKYTLGDEGDPLNHYSPDGTYVIGEDRYARNIPFRIWLARHWPGPGRQRNVLGKAIGTLPEKVQISGQDCWAPDSRHIASIQREEDGMSRGYLVLDLQGKIVAHGQGHVLDWIGGNRLLVQTGAETLVIRSISGGKEQAVARPPWQ